MELHKIVKDVFFGLMCAIIAFMLYYALFGSTKLNGTAVENQDSWKGALFYASEQMEYPVAKYYYSYCFLPSVHVDDGVDEQLGFNVAMKAGKSDDKMGTLFITDTDLSSDNSNSCNTNTSNNTMGWTTGWKSGTE